MGHAAVFNKIKKILQYGVHVLYKTRKIGNRETYIYIYIYQSVSLCIFCRLNRSRSLALVVGQREKHVRYMWEIIYIFFLFTTFGRSCMKTHALQMEITK